jgi:hypothetical protein
MGTSGPSSITSGGQLVISSGKRNNKTMKTYFVRYNDYQEEEVQANSVKLTSKLISFYRNKTLVLAVPVSEISRVGEKSFSPFKAEMQPIDVDQMISYLASRNISAPALEAMKGNSSVRN